jgi:hypothetical protein
MHVYTKSGGAINKQVTRKGGKNKQTGSALILIKIRFP